VTYVNEALDHKSCIDYILVSNNHDVIDYAVLDPNVNFSDHLPLSAVVKCDVTDGDSMSQCVHKTVQLQQRWDKGDVGSFYNYTACMFTSVILVIEIILVIVTVSVCLIISVII